MICVQDFVCWFYFPVSSNMSHLNHSFLLNHFNLSVLIMNLLSSFYVPPGPFTSLGPHIPKAHLASLTCAKFEWKSTKAAQGYEYRSVAGRHVPCGMYMWQAKGMYSSMTSRSATASPVSRALVGDVISRRVSTAMLRLLATEPKRHTTRLT
jgi:hypothetical protein